jgi:hypothetical protein
MVIQSIREEKIKKMPNYFTQLYSDEKSDLFIIEIIRNLEIFLLTKYRSII